MLPTVRLNGVERLPAVDVPSTVMLYEPAATPDPTVTVHELLVPVGAVGLNTADTPAGAPASESVTAPVKLERVMVTVVTDVVPGSVVIEDGEDDIV